MWTRTLVCVLLVVLVAVPSSGQAQKRRGGKLKSGDAVVDFTLQDTLGKQTVTLSELTGKPVVLIFGSSTSSRLVDSVSAINNIYTIFKDVAHIYVVYIRENPGKNDDDAPAPKTIQERRQVAHGFAERVGLLPPVLVDTFDDQADDAYAGWPDRIYVVDGAACVEQGDLPCSRESAKSCLSRLPC